MRCGVCGLDYGLTHNCSGISPDVASDESAPPPPGFALLYYLRLALSIVRWDDVSIRRASRDPRAGLFGTLFWGASSTVLLLFTILPQILGNQDLPLAAKVLGIGFGLAVGLLFIATITVTQLGMCYLIGTLFFKAKGTFIETLRPLLLAWFVNLLLLIPVLGQLAAAVAWIAVLMLVFEEVNGIGRLQAFLISAGVNISFLVILSLFVGFFFLP